MDRVDDESFRFYCPSFADELVGREPLQGVETTAEVIRGDEALKRGSELIVVVIVEALDGRVPYGAVHALDLAVGPWMLRLCQPVFDIVGLAGSIERMTAPDSCRP